MKTNKTKFTAAILLAEFLGGFIICLSITMLTGREGLTENTAATTTIVSTADETTTEETLSVREQTIIHAGC